MSKSINFLKSNILDRPLKNVFERKSHQGRVLISYLKEPFRKPNKKHTNHIEVISAAQVFDQLGFVVDVINFTTPLSSKKLKYYNVIYGFGDVFEKSFYADFNIRRIYYGAGAHVAHQNKYTLEALKRFYDTHGVWIPDSVRYVEKNWAHQTNLSDLLLVLGDQWVRETYTEHTNQSVKNLPTPFHKILNFTDVMKNRELKRRGNNKSFLWFGSSGCIHKGLDVVLDVFIGSEVELHVCCGDGEIDFHSHYAQKITPNITMHGFVNIEDEKFKSILEQVDFAIYPSCSEGGSPSLVTVVANGALIPIKSKQAGVSIDGSIVVPTLTKGGVMHAVEAALTMNLDEMRTKQIEAAEYCNKYHGIEPYHMTLRASLENYIANRH